MNNNLTRRSFLGYMGVSSLSSGSFSRLEMDTSGTRPLTVLFQGDSITDGNRGRSDDPNHILGHGYAFAIAARLGAKYPERHLTFINKGNSGDTVAALHGRWKADALDLKPDVIGILIGINDVFLRMKNGNLGEASTFEDDFRKLLQLTSQSLPDTKLIVAEPFILPVGMVKENSARWLTEIKIVQEMILKLATEFNCIHLPFQQLFTNALKRASADYWIWDGVHPTVNGHGLMAEEWIKQIGKVIPSLSFK